MEVTQTKSQQIQNHRPRTDSSLDSAVVEVQEMSSSHEGHLTNAIYHHGETLKSN